jgi:AraC-like DNA-binding protein
VSGKGYLHCEGKDFTIREGQIFVIFPWTVIKYEADLKTPWCYSWVNFYGSEAEEVFSRLGISPREPVYTVKNGAEIHEVMREMPFERGADIEKNLDFSARLYELMSLIIKNTEGADRGENLYLTAAKRYVRSHYFEDVTVEQIAAHVGISRKYLFAIFKSYLGVSPKDYIVSYRMKRAAELLENRDLRVGDVAYSVGYTDPLTFSKMFKLKMGVSPTEYRKSKETRRAE